MPTEKISELTSGNPAASGDLLPIDRSGANYSVTATSVAALASATGSVLSASVTLTASQVNNLKGTPIQIVAAPGSGNYISVLNSVWNFTRSASFTGASTSYCVGFSTTIYQVNVYHTFITSATSQVATCYGSLLNNGAIEGTPIPVSSAANQPLKIFNRGAADTTGVAGSTVTVTVYYTVVAIS